ncbi:uncharacterized protein LOC120355481 [Nilaparvata lugens]|uniref:uncharacterized protein LOC120355481 n=1 Tax=Nilaparvata lugens TaxID=108931 RepID=UPI00193D7FA8|nr:uncharacterized protein LOC120355481 [Nilaparvata lugens]
MTSKHDKQKCCEEQSSEIVRLIRALCATMENEENESRERQDFKELKAQGSASNPFDNCVLQCTPCRQLNHNTEDSENSSRKQRRNALPNLCSTRGQVNTNHLYVNRWVRPDPSKAPLITYPEYPKQHNKEEDDSYKAPSSKNGQIVGGVVYDHCFCSKRNGLQDDCPLTKCITNPGCKALPEPCCPNLYEERLRQAKRACEDGRYGTLTTMYCP